LISIKPSAFSAPVILQTLQGSPFFSQVQPKSLRLLAEMGRVVSFSQGELIFTQGEAAAGLYIVHRGLVRVFKLAASGKEHVLHFAEPGKTFGEVAVLGDFALPACAEACEPTTAVLLPKEELLGALRADHALCLQLLASMSFWVKHLVDLLEGIVLRDAASRVAAYLIKSARGGDGAVSLPARKRHVASHLNLTSETLSRTLRQLKDSGLVVEEGEQLRIADAAGLEAVAQGLFPRV
jgi:CRP/FNR family transcriptional regulator, dissimilatory nitrate respiration regulator